MKSKKESSLLNIIQQRDDEINHLKLKLNFLETSSRTESAKDFYEDLIARIPGNIYWMNTKNEFLGCNDQQATLANMNNRNDIVGKTNFDMPWKDQAEDLNRVNNLIIQTGEPIIREEKAHMANGCRTYLSHKVPLKDASGVVIGLLGVSLDINDLKKLEHNLANAKKQAEAANQAKTEFLENMRHDIRTPLTGIVGFSDLIKAEATNPNVKEYADNLMASSHALLDLMDEVLEAVRVSSGEIPQLKKKFSLQKTLQNIVNLNQAKAASKHLDFSLEYDDAFPNYVLGDNVRIHRIGLELVANALNFTDNGFVKLKAECAKETESQVILKLTVEDSGLGIPPDKQQEIFLQFKRLMPSYKGIYKGAGLGLAVIKQFIDDVKGEIYVDSTPQKGATFTCIIPLQKPLLDDDVGVEDTFEEELCASSSALSTNASSDKNQPQDEHPFIHRVLVVEDNFIAQKVAQSLVQSLQCQVDVASNGKEALERWQQNEYDLIFMDIGLPDMDGYQVTHHIRVQEVAKNRHTPIIALTAHVGDENKQRCIEAGMNAVLSKPLTQKSAEDTLNAFLPAKQKEKREQANVPASDLPEQDQKLFELDEFPLFDKEEGVKTAGSEEMLMEMLKLTMETLPEDCDLMVAAHKGKDWEGAQKIAHKIKGGALYIGAVRMKMACQYFERYFKCGKQALLEDLFQQALNAIHDTEKVIQEQL